MSRAEGFTGAEHTPRSNVDPTQTGREDHEAPAEAIARAEGSASDEAHAARGESEADDEPATSTGSATDEADASDSEPA